FELCPLQPIGGARATEHDHEQRPEVRFLQSVSQALEFWLQVRIAILRQPVDQQQRDRGLKHHESAAAPQKAGPGPARMERKSAHGAAALRLSLLLRRAARSRNSGDRDSRPSLWLNWAAPSGSRWCESANSSSRSIQHCPLIRVMPNSLDSSLR